MIIRLITVALVALVLAAVVVSIPDVKPYLVIRSI